MYEESERRIFGEGILSLILKLLLLAIFVFILCWLFTRNANTSKVIRETSSSYANNIATMKQAAFEYFTTDKLPGEVGESEKLSLSQMLNQKLLIDFTDNGKTCDTDSSYVQATKTADENYALKVNLTCDDQDDFIVTTIEKNKPMCVTCDKQDNSDLDDEDDNDYEDTTSSNSSKSTSKSTKKSSNSIYSGDYVGSKSKSTNNSSKSSTSKQTSTSTNSSTSNNSTVNNTTNNTTNNVTNNTTTTTTHTTVSTTVTTTVKISLSCSSCEHQKSTVIAKYVDEQGHELASRETTTGEIGSAYSTFAKNIDGYMLTVIPENAKGVYTKDTIVVTYVYSKVSKNVTYYKLVRFGEWINGNKPNDGNTYETSCSKDVVNTYCKQETKSYYSATTVREENAYSGYSYNYTIEFSDFAASDVVPGTLSIINASKYSGYNDFVTYLNRAQSGNKDINHLGHSNPTNENHNTNSMVNASQMYNSAFNNGDFSFSISSPSVNANGRYQITISITVHSKPNKDPFTYGNNNRVFFTPVKFAVTYTSKNPNACVTDSASNASKYSDYKVISSRVTDEVCKYRKVEYKWVAESDLQTYLNNNWKQTGETKTITK